MYPKLIKKLTFFLCLEVHRVEVVSVGMAMELLPKIVNIILREAQSDKTVEAAGWLQLP